MQTVLVCGSCTGRNHSDAMIILQTVDMVLVKRRKKISLQRLLAFTKRLCILALQLLHNGALGCLCLVKTTLQVTGCPRPLPKH
ncbi:hypothetical protein PR048_024456 [Dryococelus australis]|uniref:CCAAT-binding factor domain-containing protein n=1 Tax=Dryococelus australis TaxID=614101 RepID=A0ABQ9GNN6_9NEOP|nr:hypothetical protein PR048_024456 [Dryococelus australis]